MRKNILFLLLVSSLAFSQESRHFIFHYAFSVRNVAPGRQLNIWFPRAESDRFQQVRIVSVKSDLHLKRTREPRFGNAMFFATAPKAAKSEYTFEVTYDVVRKERRSLGAVRNTPVITASPAVQEMYLQPDSLVPVTGRLAIVGAQQVQGRNTPLERARALYDYTFANMRYDKSGSGWGRGDAEWACDAKRGNCTDFHSLFMSMARSQGIPARFEIGFPLPADKQNGEIAGYHCWAEFYDPQNGWVPVDISEAWKHQEKKDYFFGSHDVNRVQFSVGRDVLLSPRQQGEPLNYFIYPYVEVGGKKWENVANAFSFADAGGPAKRAGD
jgi:transglutaminase-like putative cysteine protease